MIYEFTKKRSTAVAQIEPNLTKLQELAKVAYISYAQEPIIQANIKAGVIQDLTDTNDIQAIYRNQESFKRWFSRTTNSAKPYATWNLFDSNGVLDPYIINQIQRYDTEFFAWRSSVNNAWLQLNGV